MSDLIKSACPFCGSKDIRFTGYPGMYQNSHCECKDCHTIGPAVFVDDEKAATEAWNRRTQPEATAPAPIPGLPFADLATPIKEFEARKAAAFASSANALSAGDSETERLDFVFANGLPMKRGGEYRCHGFPGEWFKTEREAIDAAIIQSQKDGHG